MMHDKKPNDKKPTLLFKVTYELIKWFIVLDDPVVGYLRGISLLEHQIMTRVW